MWPACYVYSSMLRIWKILMTEAKEGACPAVVHVVQVFYLIMPRMPAKVIHNSGRGCPVSIFFFRSGHDGRGKRAFREEVTILAEVCKPFP